MSKFAMLLSAAVLALGPTLASAGSLVEPVEEVMIEDVIAAPAGSLGGNAGLIIGGLAGLALIAALADSDDDSASGSSGLPSS